MVEVDPIVLAAGATAIAVLSVISCTRGGGKEKNDQSEKLEKKTEKKSKKVDDEKVEIPEKSNVGKSEKKNKKVEKESAPSSTVSPAPTSPTPTPPVTSTNQQSKVKAAPATQAPAPVKAPVAPAKDVEPVKVAAKVSTPEVTPEPVVATSEASDKKKKVKETPEQKAARLERQKKRKEEAEASAQPESAPETERVEFVSRVPPTDVWEVVDKKKQKPKKQPVTPTAPTGATPSGSTVEVPSAPAAPEQTTSKLTVDPKKIGIIIGPKGATLRSIQELTEATINMPKADRDTNAKSASITIVGSADAVQNATNIIIELCTKGYSTRLEGENFQESHLSVHNQ